METVILLKTTRTLLLKTATVCWPGGMFAIRHIRGLVILNANNPDYAFIITNSIMIWLWIGED